MGEGGREEEEKEEEEEEEEGTFKVPDSVNAATCTTSSVPINVSAKRVTWALPHHRRSRASSTYFGTKRDDDRGWRVGYGLWVKHKASGAGLAPPIYKECRYM